MLIPVKNYFLTNKIFFNAVDKDIEKATSRNVYKQIAIKFNKSFLNVDGGSIFRRPSIEVIVVLITQDMRNR